MAGGSDRRVLLLVSGSTRNRSTNTAALRAVAKGLATEHDVRWAPDLAAFPAFNPDDDHPPLPAAVQRLRDAIAAADAVLCCAPEYAGTLPGAFKNLLDWCVGGIELDAKPVAWLNVSSPGRGQGASETLATVLGYVNADVVTDACRAVPVGREVIDEDGEITDPRVVADLVDAARALLAARR